MEYEHNMTTPLEDLNGREPQCKTRSTAISMKNYLIKENMQNIHCSDCRLFELTKQTLLVKLVFFLYGPLAPGLELH